MDKCSVCKSEDYSIHYCEDCGKPFCERHIIYEEDPFAAEIHDDHTKVWACEDCRLESVADI